MSVRIQAVRDRLGAEAGLTGVQYSVLVSLINLARRGEPVTISALARHLHVSATFITAESKKLAKVGLVEKLPNPADRRSVLLQATTAGRERLDAILPTVRQVNDVAFRDLDRRDFLTASELAEKLVNALDDALPPLKRNGK